MVSICAVFCGREHKYRSDGDDLDSPVQMISDDVARRLWVGIFLGRFLTPTHLGVGEHLRIFGSARESVKTLILRGFPNNEEFGLERGHALSLEKEIAKILVSSASA